MTTAMLTTDPETIKNWAQERNGKPAEVKGTEDGEPGVLRIEFPDYGGSEDLKRLQWPSLFKKMAESNLALLYQETTSHGDTSRFCKFVYAPSGVLAVLHEEHERIRKILSDLQSTTTNATKTRPKLLEQLREVLVPHMKAEKKAVYKKLKKAAGSSERMTTILEGYEEHRHASRALSRLEKADPESEDFTARLSVLKELVEHHIDEEESEMFDTARNIMGEEGLEELRDLYLEKQRKQQKKLN